MNRKEFQQHQYNFLSSLLKTGETKQKEYASNSDAFHNFENGKELAIVNSREEVAWEYCTKHLQSVKDIISNIENNHASINQAVIDEKFGDIIIYMTLIHGMLTDRINNNYDGKS